MKSNGLATILLMIPVLTVPALAIFGIPQFAPVVASPLEENGKKDFERGLGNSARISQDELFDDIEAFDSARTPRPNTASSIRNRNLATDPPRNSRLRRSETQQAATWGDDLEQVAEQRRPNPSSSSIDAGDLSAIKMARYERNPRRNERINPSLSVGGPDEADTKITQVAYSDDRTDHIETKRDERSKPSVARNAGVRETAAEELTWSVAVERLNELEIRNFRLEPGPRLGLFVFICTYTPPDSPTVSYRFESEADQPLKAVQKVLEQIQEWRQRR